MALPSVEIVGEHGACAVTAFVSDYWSDEHGNWWESYGLRITRSGWWSSATFAFHWEQRLLKDGSIVGQRDESFGISFPKGQREEVWTESNLLFATGEMWKQSIIEDIAFHQYLSNCRITFNRAYLHGYDPLCDESTGEMLRNANGEIVRGI